VKIRHLILSLRTEDIGMCSQSDVVVAAPTILNCVGNSQMISNVGAVMRLDLSVRPLLYKAFWLHTNDQFRTAAHTHTRTHTYISCGKPVCFPVAWVGICGSQNPVYILPISGPMLYLARWYHYYKQSTQ
jgi:hypothetical protein